MNPLNPPPAGVTQQLHLRVHISHGRHHGGYAHADAAGTPRDAPRARGDTTGDAPRTRGDTPGEKGVTATASATATATSTTASTPTTSSTPGQAPGVHDP
jgi:hypothetical protein